MDTELVTFGKHRGHTLRQLLEDEKYMMWLGKQPWWPDKYECKVLLALRRGDETLPPKPAVKPLLEPEYDFAGGERPVKVRKLTHCEPREVDQGVECPNCYQNSFAPVVTAHARDDLYVCTKCAQHVSVRVWAADQGGGGEYTAKTLRFRVARAECPIWSGRTQQDYERACSHCPEHKGVFANHGACGCLETFECQCLGSSST